MNVPPEAGSGPAVPLISQILRPRGQKWLHVGGPARANVPGALAAVQARAQIGRSIKNVDRRNAILVFVGRFPPRELGGIRRTERGNQCDAGLNASKRL